MLQAATGKLFTYDVERTNVLRGVVYTNISFLAGEGFETSIGSIQSLSSRSFPNVFNCSITEKIEKSGSGPGVLVSNSISAYIQDFSDVISFVLGVTCTPDIKAAERALIEKSRISRDPESPALKRYFSPDIVIKTSEIEHLKQVTSDLIALRRAQYLAAIKSIRSYTTAVYRSKDDLDLAYTLLIISLESLVQNFDSYETSWADLNEIKRKPIDKALTGLSTERAESIREAVLSGEHVALSRRFKQFVFSHIPDDYFGKMADTEPRPAGKKDLKQALDNLYQTRSKYVHELVSLPRNMLHAVDAETVVIDGKILFTFQGLLRLAKTVILEFILRQEKIEKEPCNYMIDNPNIIFAKMCPSTWVGNTQGLATNNCLSYFGGFIELIGNFYEAHPNGKIYDVREVITNGLKLKGLKPNQKRSLLGMHFIFNYFIRGDQQSKIKISKADLKSINEPSLESLITHVIIGQNTEWDTKDHEKYYHAYYNQRLNKSGIYLSNKIEACLGLSLAESFRLSNQIQECVAQLRTTAEDHPALIKIRELSENFDSNTPIQWITLVYSNIVKPTSNLECVGL